MTSLSSHVSCNSSHTVAVFLVYFCEQNSREECFHEYNLAYAYASKKFSFQKCPTSYCFECQKF